MPKTLFLSQEMRTERWEWGCESDRFSTEATVGGLREDAWPVSPWLIPRAQGQEVANDPGRIQTLLCLSVSNHYQILHSDGQQAQTPLSEALKGYVRALQFFIFIIQVLLLGELDSFVTSCFIGVYTVTRISSADTNSSSDTVRSRWKVDLQLRIQNYANGTQSPNRERQTACDGVGVM